MEQPVGRHDGVKFVLELPEDLINQVLECDHPSGAAKLIENDCDVKTIALEQS